MKRVLMLLTVFSLLAACGQSGSGGDVENNQADVEFVTGMIPHHQQAIEMAMLVESRSDNAEVKDLATRIQMAQAPEIETMDALLEAWGVGATMDMDSDMEGSGGGLAGMMDPAGLEALKAAKGKEFDRKFLEAMTEHHNGAVEAAKEALSKGQSSEAKKLAEEIIAAQEAELTEMKNLLTKI